MNKFGTEDPDRGQAYCEQRLAMDNFMSEAVLRLVDERNNLMRSRYKKHVAELGARQDGFCQRFTHYGRTYLPAGRATYMGGEMTGASTINPSIYKIMTALIFSYCLRSHLLRSTRVSNMQKIEE